MKILILDTSAFLSGFLLGDKEKCYTIQEVIDEIKRGDVKLRTDIYLKEGRLKIVEPQVTDIAEIKKAAAATGDLIQLSETDIKLLSAAYRFKVKGHDPIIVSDDYDIQNLAHKLELKFASIIEGKIKKILRWKNVCRGCGKQFAIYYKGRCDVCGAALNKVAKPINKRIG